MQLHLGGVAECTCSPWGGGGGGGGDKGEDVTVISVKEHKTGQRSS